jgi:hypothetical protein
MTLHQVDAEAIMSPVFLPNQLRRRLVVSTAFNSLETRQWYGKHVPMFESVKKHFDHGVTGFNINLCDSSPDQF